MRAGSNPTVISKHKNYSNTNCGVLKTDNKSILRRSQCRQSLILGRDIKQILSKSCWKLTLYKDMKPEGLQKCYKTLHQGQGGFNGSN